MGNQTFSCLTCVNPPKDLLSLSFIIVGLDNAGKTTIYNRLIGENHLTSIPTFGLQTKSIEIDNTCVTFFDVGGSKSIRGYWEHYFFEVFGVIFVFDIALNERVEEACSLFNQIIENTYVKNKPFLIFFNKIDLLSSEQLPKASSYLISQLYLHRISNYQIFYCSAYIDSEIISNPYPLSLSNTKQGNSDSEKLKNTPKNSKPKPVIVDPQIQKGISWLISHCCLKYEVLWNQIKVNLEEKKQIEIEESEKRQQELEKLRQERMEKENKDIQNI